MFFEAILHYNQDIQMIFFFLSIVILYKGEDMNTIKRVNRLKITASFILLLSFLLTAPVFAGEAEKRTCENGSEKEIEKEELFRDINQYRESQGLSALSESKSLSNIAEQRAEECSLSFSHNRPEGGCVLDIKDVCGEILAKNERSAVNALDAWEKSPSHNKLILRGDYKRFGCAHYIDESGADYFVVLFSYYQ